MNYEQAMQDYREWQRCHFSPEFEPDEEEPTMDEGNVADDYNDEKWLREHESD